MYTNCPECGTVFRINSNDLRVAEGYVRCGHCSATFNALGSLTDEPPALQATATDEPVPAGEDSLEFNIPEGNWSDFFESEAAGKSDPTAPVLAAPEVEEEVGGELPAPQTDVGDGIGSATVDQAGLFRALSAETVDSVQDSVQESVQNPGLDDAADWRELLAEVPDDEELPEPVYVISDEQPDELPPEYSGEPALPEYSWAAPAPLPAKPLLQRPAPATRHCASRRCCAAPAAA